MVHTARRSEEEMAEDEMVVMMEEEETREAGSGMATKQKQQKQRRKQQQQRVNARIRPTVKHVTQLQQSQPTTLPPEQQNPFLTSQSPTKAKQQRKTFEPLGRTHVVLAGDLKRKRKAMTARKAKLRDAIVKAAIRSDNGGPVAATGDLKAVKLLLARRRLL